MTDEEAGEYDLLVKEYDKLYNSLFGYYNNSGRFWDGRTKRKEKKRLSEISDRMWYLTRNLKVKAVERYSFPIYKEIK